MIKAVGVSAAGMGLSPIAQAVKALYQIAGSIDDYINNHIEKLKQSVNPTVACAGRVLEGAKFGFGLGYLTSIAIIAVGQLLLGNPLAAAGAILTGATLTNPIAMTCAAVGAIYYGWSALSDKERADILDRLAAGLEMGVDLIRSLVDFVIRTTKDALRSKQLTAFKDFVRAQAGLFGKSLFDVTGKVGDLVKGAAEKASDLTGQAVGATAIAVKDAYGAAARGANSAGTATREAAGRAAGAAATAKDVTVTAARRALGRRAAAPAVAVAKKASDEGGQAT